MLLNGKTIIITGASSGIGAAAAKIFAADGAKVVLGARRAELLEQITVDISETGGEAAFLAGDVQDSAYAADLVKLAESRFGGARRRFQQCWCDGGYGTNPRHGRKQLAQSDSG